MMMKKYGMILALAAGVLLAASCEKVNNDLPSGKVNMTLTASIANPETKTSYNDAGDGKLSVTWSGEEKISVLIVNDDGTIDANCPLTYTGTSGLKEITFSGSVDALSSGQKYVCVYPALVTKDGDYNSSTGTLDYQPSLKKLRYEAAGSTSLMQGDFTPDALKDADFLTGTAEEVSGGGYNVVLTRQIGILKLIIKVPTTDDFINKSFLVTGIYSNYATPPFATALRMNLYTQTCEPEYNEMAVLMTSFSIPASGEIVLYIPLGPCTLYGGMYGVLLSGMSSGKQSDPIETVKSGDIEIKAGYMTTITFDVSSVLWNNLS